MTKQIMSFLFALIFYSNYSIGQCEQCDKALAKDYMQYSSSTLQQLNVLRLMDKETFDEYKKSSSGGGGLSLGIPGIVSATINGSSNYDEFRQNREKLFQLYSYNYTETQAKDELKIVTNPIAYTEWSKCIVTCYENQANLSRVYGYITYADSNTILVKVKYKATSTSKSAIRCTIHVDDGSVLKESGRGRGGYYEDIDFVLTKGDDIGFTIKRSDKEKPTTISISSDGSDVFREVSKCGNKADNKNILATAKYTLTDTKETFSRWNDAKVESPDLHEKKCRWIDLYRRAYRQVLPNVDLNCDGDLIKATNIIEFPGLAENEYYKSITPYRCLRDNDGASGWNEKYRHQAVYTISPDKRHASVKFFTGSRDCSWISQAEVFTVTTTISQQCSSVLVKENYFVVTIPQKASAATIIVKINENEFLVNPGQDDALGKIKFINHTEDGTNNYYSYFIK